MQRPVLHRSINLVVVLMLLSNTFALTSAGAARPAAASARTQLAPEASRLNSQATAAEATVSITDGGFATILPFAPETAPLIEPALAALRDALRTGRLEEVRLHFASGLTATVRRRHRLRYWRTTSPVPELERKTP